MGFHVVLHHAHELADVFDARLSLVGALGLQRGNQPALLDDHLHDGVQLALHFAGFAHQQQEVGEGAAGGGAASGLAGFHFAGLQEGAAVHVGGVLNAVDGGLPNAAAGRVDDARGRHVVGGVDRQLEVGHHVAHLGAFEEAGAAHNFVGDAGAQQHVFQRAALRVRAVKQRHLVVGFARVVEFLNLAGNPAALVALVGGQVERNLLARLARGEQLLGLAPAVVRDDRVGRIQNVGRGAVVLLQLHHLGGRPVLLEVQNVADVGAAPGVNRLVVVAHHHQVAVHAGQQLRDGILRLVRVLVLVDHDVAEGLRIAAPHLGVLAQQLVSVEKQVVEVHRVGPLEATLQLRVNVGGALGERVLRVRGIFRRPHQLVLRRRNLPAHALLRVKLRVVAQVLHHGLHQPLGFVVVINGEAVGEAQQFGVLSQNANTHAVEGGHPHAAATAGHQVEQTFAHLPRRLVREGDRQDVPRGHAAIFNQVRNAIRQHAGLPAARARQNKKRPFCGEDRFVLRAV